MHWKSWLATAAVVVVVLFLVFNINLLGSRDLIVGKSA